MHNIADCTMWLLAGSTCVQGIVRASVSFSACLSRQATAGFQSLLSRELSPRDMSGVCLEAKVSCAGALSCCAQPVSHQLAGLEPDDTDWVELKPAQNRREHKDSASMCTQLRPLVARV